MPWTPPIKPERHGFRGLPPGRVLFAPLRLRRIELASGPFVGGVPQRRAVLSATHAQSPRGRH